MAKGFPNHTTSGQGAAVKLTSRRRRRCSGDSSLSMLGCVTTCMVCTAACINCWLLKPRPAAAVMASRILALVSPAHHHMTHTATESAGRWPASPQKLLKTLVRNHCRAS